MKLQNVRYFLTLCEEKNFTRAAKRCGIAQPTLTAAIKRLERQLGGALFHRQKMPKAESKPTGLALAIKPYFEQVFLALRATQDIAKAHQAEKPDNPSRGRPDLG